MYGSEEALGFLRQANGAVLSGGAAADQGPEPVVLLTEVALTLADLPGTTEQVKKFQTDHKLPATGIVDAATWSALEANPTTSTTAATTTTKG